MKRLSWPVQAVSLVCWLFAEPSSGVTHDDRSDSIRVELCDTTELDPSILSAARDEAVDIFAKGAARLDWQSECETPPPTTLLSARIYVLPRVPGGLANRYYEYGGKKNVMGYFGYIDDVRDAVLGNPTENRAAVIYVARQAVETTVSRSGRIPFSEAQLSRALGRVFAHELAHRLLGPTHTRNGILKDFLDQRNLIGEDNSGLFFSPEQIHALRLLVGSNVEQRPQDHPNVSNPPGRPGRRRPRQPAPRPIRASARHPAPP